MYRHCENNFIPTSIDIGAHFSPTFSQNHGYVSEAQPEYLVFRTSRIRLLCNYLSVRLFFSFLFM